MSRANPSHSKPPCPGCGAGSEPGQSSTLTVEWALNLRKRVEVWASCNHHTRNSCGWESPITEMPLGVRPGRGHEDGARAWVAAMDRFWNSIEQIPLEVPA